MGDFEDPVAVSEPGSGWLGSATCLDTEPLPPGETLYIQEPACCSRLKPRMSFYVDKPVSLEAVPSDKWDQFQSEVNHYAKQIINHELLMLCLIPIVVLSWLPSFPATNFLNTLIKCATPLVPFGGSYIVVNRNKKFDNCIRGLCAEFARESGIPMQYHTQYTGLCKNLDKFSCRAIVVLSRTVVPGTVAGGPQSGSVQVIGRELDGRSFPAVD